jgi:hypothetical protein
VRRRWKLISTADRMKKGVTVHRLQRRQRFA